MMRKYIGEDIVSKKKKNEWQNHQVIQKRELNLQYSCRFSNLFAKKNIVLLNMNNKQCKPPFLQDCTREEVHVCCHYGVTVNTWDL